jgi:hypothetical protein
MPSSKAQRNILFATLIVVAGFIYLFLYLKDTYDKFITTAVYNLGTPGVRTGQGFVKPTVLIQDNRLGPVMDVTSDRQDPTLIWIAGKKCIMSVQSDGKVVNAFTLPNAAYHFRLIDLNNKIALFNTGSWMTPTSLFDTLGNVIWSYTDDGKVNDAMACYNILGNNKTQFVVGLNGSDGIRLLTETGYVVWKVPEKNVSHVEACDLNDDGKIKIVHNNADGKLIVRNSDGSLLATDTPPVFVTDFTLTDWINSDGPTAAVIPDQTKYMFFSLSKAAPVTEWETGFKLKTGKTRACWVVWNPNSGKSLALLTTYALSHQALLTIYSESGEMQFQEVIPEACEGIGMVDGPMQGSHVLLIGLENKVIQYQKPN